MPFFWVGELLAVMGALHESITLLVMPRLDAATTLDLVERERATGIVGWPAFTQRLREHPTFAARDLSSAPMLRDGPLDIAMTDVPGTFPMHRTMSETAGGFAFTDIAIVDEDGRPVAAGTTGELLVRGIGVMAGYDKRERWETFDADGSYHTGDRVYRANGDPRLFYVGRTSESEARRALMTARGREQLSGYKVPTRWVTATSEQIPTLPSGKINRKAVREWFIQQS
jgi:acyl-CoA synthetase (AMP-forming)/AMP-acid ligase II